MSKQTANEIKKVAMDLDIALENKDIEKVISFFAEDCELHLLNIKLEGKDGIRTWLN